MLRNFSFLLKQEEVLRSRVSILDYHDGYNIDTARAVAYRPQVNLESQTAKLTPQFVKISYFGRVGEIDCTKTYLEAMA